MLNSASTAASNGQNLVANSNTVAQVISSNQTLGELYGSYGTERNLASGLSLFLQMSNQLANTNTKLAKLTQDYGIMMEQKVQAEKIAMDALAQKLLAEQGKEEALKEKARALEERARAVEEKARALEEKARVEEAKKAIEEKEKKTNASREMWKQKYRTLSRAVSRMPWAKRSVAQTLFLFRGATPEDKENKQTASNSMSTLTMALSLQQDQKVSQSVPLKKSPLDNDKKKLERLGQERTVAIEALLEEKENTRDHNLKSIIDHVIFQLLSEPKCPVNKVACSPSLQSMNSYGAYTQTSVYKSMLDMKKVEVSSESNALLLAYQLYVSNALLKSSLQGEASNVLEERVAPLFNVSMSSQVATTPNKAVSITSAPH